MWKVSVCQSDLRTFAKKYQTTTAHINYNAIRSWKKATRLGSLSPSTPPSSNSALLKLEIESDLAAAETENVNQNAVTDQVSSIGKHC